MKQFALVKGIIDETINKKERMLDYDEHGKTRADDMAVMALLCGCQADDETPPTEQTSPQETAVVSTSTPTPAEVRTLTREEYEEWMHERSAVDGKLCISRSDDEYLKALPQDEPHSFEITYDPFYLTCEEYRERYGEILSLMKKQSELVYRTQAELIAAGENGSAT